MTEPPSPPLLLCPCRAPKMRCMHVRVRRAQDGHLPLHLAAANQASTEVVLALLSAYPVAAWVADSLGQLPLHHAAANQASAEVVAALLVAHPGAARPTPATHAILSLLKAGECIRHSI